MGLQAVPPSPPVCARANPLRWFNCYFGSVVSIVLPSSQLETVRPNWHFTHREGLSPRVQELNICSKQANWLLLLLPLCFTVHFPDINPWEEVWLCACIIRFPYWKHANSRLITLPACSPIIQLRGATGYWLPATCGARIEKFSTWCSQTITFL